MSTLPYQKLTYKDYMDMFRVSSATAKRYIAADRKKAGLKRFTANHFAVVNGVFAVAGVSKGIK